MPKIHTKNGFEYYSENNMGIWSWHYRPCGRIPFMQLGTSAALSYKPAKKVDMLALLDDPVRALACYQEDLASRSDVDAARAHYERAKARYEETLQPDWEDDFRGNNPGKIGRKTKGIASDFRSAEWRLAAAIRLQKELQKENDAFAD